MTTSDREFLNHCFRQWYKYSTAYSYRRGRPWHILAQAYKRSLGL